MALRIALALCLLASAAYAQTQSVIVGSGATEEVFASGELQPGPGKVEIQSGGVLSLSGSSSSALARMTSPTAGLAIDLLSGGAVDFKFARFENIGTLTVSSGGTVRRIHDATFIDAASDFGAYPWIDLSAAGSGDRHKTPFSINRVTFEAYGSTTNRKNVKAGANTPLVRVLGNSGHGDRWGEANDDDSSDRILWNSASVQRDSPSTTFDTLEEALADGSTTSSSTLTVDLGANAFIDDVIDFGASGAAKVKNACIARITGAAVADSDGDSTREGTLLNCAIARGSVDEAVLDGVTIFPATGTIAVSNCSGDRVLIGDGSTVTQSGNAFTSSLSTATSAYFVDSSAYNFHLAHPGGVAAIDSAPEGSGGSIDWEGTQKGTIGTVGATTWDYGADECTPPAAPVLSVSDRAAGSITWAWTNVSGESAYRLYADGHAASEGYLAQKGPDVLFHQDIWLFENTQYTRHLHALYGGVPAGNSNSFSAYSGVHTPVIGEFTVALPNPAQDFKVDIAWTSSFPNQTVGQSGRRIERSSNGLDPASWVEVLSWTNSTATYQDTTPSGGTWHYRIQFRNADGYATAVSPSRNIVVNGSAGAVSPPTLITATPGSSPTRVTLDWSDNTELNLRGYNLYRRTRPWDPGNYILVNGTTLWSSTYVDTGVTAGTPYFYIVKAVNTAGAESGASNELNAVPGGSDSSVPPPPEVTTLPAIRKTSAVRPITKGYAEPGSQVDVYAKHNVTQVDTHLGAVFANSATGEWSLTADEDLGVTSQEHAYTFRATAMDPYNPPSASSNTVVATVDRKPPAAPTDIRVVAFSGCVVVEWANPADADFAGVAIYRSTTQGVLGSLLNSEQGVDPYTGQTKFKLVTGTKFRDSGASNGTPYYYTVKAVDDCVDF